MEGDPSPLFPVLASHDADADADASTSVNASAVAAKSSSSWLANTSFDTTLLSSIRHSPPPPSPPLDNEEPGLEQLEQEQATPTPSSDDSRGSIKRAKSKHKKKKKRKKKKDEDRHETSTKRPRVFASSQAKLAKDYLVDTRGDLDNLAFGSLYRMDVARYRTHGLQDNLVAGSSSYATGKRTTASFWNSEVDSASLDGNPMDEGRYCSAKFYAFQRRNDIKRMLVNSNRKFPVLPWEDYIPLQNETVVDQNSELRVEPEITDGETWEDYVYRKTKEFNSQTIERPHDESLWISFAKFQDQLIARQRKKSAQLHALEKKISILEKSHELNPDSEELLLMLLETSKKRDNTSILIQKWENALMLHPGSYRLWRSFIRLCQGEFSLLTVSKMREVYGHALQALSSACNKVVQKGQKANKSQFFSKDLEEAEHALVDVFVSLCKFEWQTGHRELCIGLFQAEIEYSLFSPSLNLSEQNKKRLFEYFWSSDGARVGEEGALGWASWLEKEEEDRQKATMLCTDTKDEQPGGWTGWSELPFNAEKMMVDKDKESSDVQLSETESEEEEIDKNNEVNDLGYVMSMLGLNFDNGKEAEIKDTKIWKRWADEEAKRDHEQWMPLHKQSGSDACGNSENEDGDILTRTILFEDIKDFLFSLECEEARLSLILQMVDFCSGSLNDWTGTNSTSWKEKLVSLDAATGTLLEELKNIEHVAATEDIHGPSVSLDNLIGNVEWIHESKGRLNFFCNLLLQCIKTFPQASSLKKTLLIARGYAESDADSENSRLNATRAFAKKLIRNNRQDMHLCGTYASIEAAAGNIEMARKIFDMALLAVNDLSVGDRWNACPLYLLYAEAELANSDASSQQRVIHILCCLGCCEKYFIYSPENQISSARLVKAHRGFEEQRKKLASSLFHGDINENVSIFIVCSALFEDLISGWEAASKIFEDAFSMVLPGRRHQTFQIEWLYLRYIQMLEKHRTSLTPLQIWNTIIRGLNQYPYNPRICKSLVCYSSLPAFTSRIRRMFDEFSQRYPSSYLWLFALSFEISKHCSGPRIHELFEHALNNPETQQSIVLWRCYLAYELYVENNPDAARRVFFRAVHSCPWSKLLWLDGFKKLNNILTAKELSDLQDVMREKELRIRTDIYEILLEEEARS